MGSNITPPRRGEALVNDLMEPLLRFTKFLEDISRAIYDSAENRRYLGGTDYTVTGTAGFALVRSVAIPYQTALQNSWRMKFSVDYTCTTSTTPNITLSGVTFKTGVTHAITVTPGSSNWAKASATAATGDIAVTLGTTSTAVSLWGDVELDSKPTWAD